MSQYVLFNCLGLTCLTESLGADKDRCTFILTNRTALDSFYLNIYQDLSGRCSFACLAVMVRRVYSGKTHVAQEVSRDST